MLNSRSKRIIAGVLMTIIIVTSFQSLATNASNEPITKNESITKGELIQELLQQFDIQVLPLTEKQENAYQEQQMDSSMAAVLEAAKRVGILNEADQVQVNQHATREEALRYLINGINVLHSYSTDVLTSYKDVAAVTDDSKQVFSAAISLGLLVGYPDQTLRPKAPIREKELQTILNRIDENIDQVTFVHTNDLHGRVLDNESRGEMGFGKIGAIVNDQRERQEHVFVLDMGDTFHGTNYVNLNQGLTAIAAMNAVGYDAMVAGNHDFNFGYKRLLDITGQLDFPIISANIFFNDEKLLMPYTVIEKGGHRFALIGVTATDTPTKTHPDNVKDLIFRNEVEIVRETLQKLETEENVDHVIVISHSGLSVDREIAQAFEDEILLIFGGHSHSTIESPLLLNQTYITQAYEHGKAVGVTSILFFEGEVIGVNGSLKRDSSTLLPDPNVQAILDEYKGIIDHAMQERVGQVDHFLDGSREMVRTSETNLGNFIADALRRMVDAEIAFTNGGGIRASLEYGDVTMGDINEVLPFDNYVIKLELTGEHIWKSLEHSVSQYPNQNGGFLQVSGLQFKYDPSQPAYERVIEVQVGGEPIELDRTYTVATNDFIATGGDGYEWLKEATVLADTGERLSTALVRHIQSNPVLPKAEGRIQMVE